MSPEERFWSHVDKNGPVPSHAPELGRCWVWTASRQKAGHGRWRTSHSAPSISAARFSWELANGPIPDGLEPDHLCRFTPCVRPDHLEPVTHRENMLRGQTIVALNASKTQCVHGHPFNEQNTRINTRGDRACKACDMVRSAKYRKAS